jgi:pimeloyl-ACP methyl ester carboxylesterase
MAEEVVVGAYNLPGILFVPDAPKGLIIFAHGSGSSRLSPRNAYAADYLGARGFATLLFDLLTPAESSDRRNVFDISLLARRVVDAVAWARTEARLKALPIGLFGASTGGGAAIVAAAAREDVAAVVSRGGRPDLAEGALSRVGAPTLLIGGGDDREVLALNRNAQARMTCHCALHVVPGAGHLFEEPGTLDEALRAAGAWFEAICGGRNDPTAVR